MVAWRHILAAVAITMAAPACVDVWGLDTLNMGEAGPAPEMDSSLPVEDGSPGRDGSLPGDAGHPPPPPNDGATPPEAGSEAGSDAGSHDTGAADAGTCNPDPSVSCTSLGVAYAGFSCTGTIQPPAAGATGAICTAVGSVGATTSYCCEGNWCGEPSDNSCDTCLASQCPSPDCLCDNTGSLDSQGDTACFNYAQCVLNCNDTFPECESECASGYASDVVTAGNTLLNCVATYCAGPCD